MGTHLITRLWGHMAFALLFVLPFNSAEAQSLAIHSISPSPACPGGTVTLVGSGFHSQGAPTVEVDGQPTTILSSSDTLLQVIPSTNASGNLLVRVSTGTQNDVQNHPFVGIVTVTYPIPPYCQYPTAQISPMTSGPVTFSAASMNANDLDGSGNLDLDSVGNSWVVWQSNQCLDQGDSISLDVIAPANPTTFSYVNNSICQNASNRFWLAQAIPSGGVFQILSGSGLVWDSTNGTIDALQSAPGNYVLSYSPAQVRCAPPDTAQVTILQGTVASLNYPQSRYCTFQTNPFPSSSGGGTWSFFDAGGADVNSSSGQLNLSGSSPVSGHEVFIGYAIGGACPDTAITSVQVFDISADFSINGTFCESYGGTGNALNVDGPGTFSLPSGMVPAGPLSITGAAGQHPLINIDSSGGSAGYVSFTLDSTGNGCIDADSVFVDVRQQRFVDSMIRFSDTLYCTSEGVQSLIGLMIPGDYLFSPTSGLDLDSTLKAISPSSSVPGVYNLQAVAITPPCRDTAEFQRVIIENNFRPSLDYDTIYCKPPIPQTVPPNLAFPSGGIFMADSGMTIDSVNGRIDLIASLSNQDLAISYELAGSRCSTAVFDTVRIVEPLVSFTYLSDSLCDANPPLAVNTFSSIGSTQGTFAISPSHPGFNPQTGELDPSSPPLGTFTISYVSGYGPSNLCPANLPATYPNNSTGITVYASPDPSFFYPNDTLCANSPSALFMPNAFTQNGVYSISSGNCALVDPTTGEINLANSSHGPCVVKYEFSGKCPREDSFAFQIVEFVADFYYPDDSLCDLDALELPVEDSISPPGGTYGYAGSISGLAIDSITGGISPAGSTPGVYNVTYTISEGICTEAFQAYSPVTVYASEDPNFSYNPNVACLGSAPLDIIQPAHSADRFAVVSGGCTVDSLTGQIDVAASQFGECVIRREFPGDCYVSALDTVTIYNFQAVFSYAEDTLCTLNGPLAVTWDTLVGGPGVFEATPAGLALDSVTGTIDPGNSPTSNYVIEYTISEGGCSNQFTSQNQLTIEFPPNPTVTYPVNLCPGVSNPTPTIFSAGGVFSVVSGGCVVDSLSGEISLGASDTGFCSIQHEIPGDCYVADTFTVHILDFTYDFGYPDDSACRLDSILLPQVQAYSGQTISFPAINGLDIHPSSGAIDPAFSQPGVYGVQAVLTDSSSGCTETISARDSIEIYNPLNPAFVYPNLDICPNSINPVPSGPNINHPQDSFFVSLGGCVVDSLSGEIYLGVSDTGYCTIVRSFPGDCYVDSAVTVRIFEFDAQLTYPKDSVCILEGQQSPQLITSGQTPSFVSIPTGLVISGTTGVIDPGLSQPGIYAVQLTLSLDGCQEIFYANDSIEIYEPLDPSVNYPASLCPQGPSLTPTVGDPGGTFTVVSGGCVVDSLTGVIDYVNSQDGPCEIEYAHGDSCPVAALDTINIYRFGAVFDYLDNSICNLDTPMVPLFSSQTNTGAFYSQPTMGSGFDPLNGTIAPDSSNLGTYSIHYAIDSGGCRDTFMVDTTVQIYLSPDPFISYAPLICPADSNFILPMVNDPGGTFSVVQGGCVVDAVTGIIDVDASAIGLCTIRYEFGGDCPIADSATLDIYRFSSSFSYPDDSVCTLDEKLYPTGMSSNSGTFFAIPSLTTGALHPDSGWVLPGINTVGTYEINFRIDSGGCQETFLVAPSLVIYEPFDPTVSYAPHICMDSANPMPTIVDTGGIFRVLPGPGNCALDSTTGEIDLTNSSAGIYTIEYFFQGDCPVSDTALIEIHDSNQTMFFYPQDTFCALPDTILPILGPNFVGGFSFNVVQGPILAMNASSGTIVLDLQTPTGLYVIEYGDVAPFMCPQFSRDTFRILEGDNPLFEYESATYCDSMLVARPQLNTLPATLGFYLGDSGLVWADSAQGFVDLTLSSPGPHSIEFIPTGGVYCPGSKTATINIVSYDTQTTFAYPQDTVCYQGGIFQPIVSGDNSGFFLGDPVWLDTVSGSVDLGLTPLGDLQVKYQLTGVCQELLCDGFHVEPREDPAFSYPMVDYCPNDAWPSPIPGNIVTPGGGFSASPSLVVDSLTGRVNLSASQSGFHWVYYTTPGRCPSTDSFRIQIFPRVIPLSWQIEPDSAICDGETMCIATSFASTIVYQVNDSTEASEVSVHCFEGLADGDLISLIHSNDTNCLDSVLIPVTVFPVPQLALDEDSTIVNSDSELNLQLIGNEPNMQAHWWSESLQGANISPDSGTVDFDADALAELVADLSSQASNYPSRILLFFEPITNFCQGDLDSLLVLLNPADVQVFIPEVFTPNGDGWNDTWKVQWVSEVDPGNFSLQVFNRSYGKVLEMTPLHPNWDGNQLPDGVYRWVLRDASASIVRVGGVTIRRR